MGAAATEAEVAAWRAAASSGDGAAAFSLALAYDRGEGGLDVDPVEAFRWYQAAADAGDARGQCNAGWCWEHGEGVEESAAEAARCYRLAAEQGSLDGQLNLALCYEKGRGVEIDPAAAAQWRQRARPGLGGLPGNWRPEVGFTQVLLHSGEVPHDQRELFRAVSAPTPGVEIRAVAEEGHPAFGEGGLYNVLQRKDGDLLGRYTGVLVPQAESSSRYLFSLHGTGLNIDAAHFGNEFRFMNAPQEDGTVIVLDTGKQPNVVAREEFWPSPGVCLYARGGIHPGEELLFDYGPNYFL